jgi:hypothetical protein
MSKEISLFCTHFSAVKECLLMLRYNRTHV